MKKTISLYIVVENCVSPAELRTVVRNLQGVVDESGYPYSLSVDAEDDGKNPEDA